MKTNTYATVLAAALLASSAALHAQTFTGHVLPIASSVAPDHNLDGITDYSNHTSSGYTHHTLQGQNVFNAVGLTLSYTPEVVYGPPFTPFSDSDVIISNVGDITGGGIQLDRYLSVTIGPDNFTALDGYAGEWNFSALQLGGTLATDWGEHFEIRTSLDGFAGTLLRYENNPTFAAPTYVSPELEPYVDIYRFDSSYLATISSPIELRFYTWYDEEGGDGNLSRFNGTAGDQNWGFSYQLTAVPEPSGTLLLGLTGTLALLRRRRTA